MWHCGAIQDAHQTITFSKSVNNGPKNLILQILSNSMIIKLLHEILQNGWKSKISLIYCYVISQPI
jgi:hypothetical protein